MGSMLFALSICSIKSSKFSQAISLLGRSHWEIGARIAVMESRMRSASEGPPRSWARSSGLRFDFGAESEEAAAAEEFSTDHFRRSEYSAMVVFVDLVL